MSDFNGNGPFTPITLRAKTAPEAPSLAREHAHAIAAAVVDYINVQDVRYPERARACNQAYQVLVSRIEDALTFAEKRGMG